MKISELPQNANFSLIEGTLSDDREINGKHVGDLLSYVMSHAAYDNAWVTIQTNINVVAVAHLLDLSCVIFADSNIPDEEAVIRAKREGIALFTTDLDACDTIICLDRLGV